MKKQFVAAMSALLAFAAQAQANDLQGEFVMTPESCEGYYSTLLPFPGNALTNVTLSEGDVVSVEQPADDELMITFEDRQISYVVGAVEDGVEGYRGRVRKSTRGGTSFTIEDIQVAAASVIHRNATYSVNGESDLVLEFRSITNSLLFPDVDLESVCVLERL